jgi:hypothetical protein
MEHSHYFIADPQRDRTFDVYHFTALQYLQCDRQMQTQIKMRQVETGSHPLLEKVCRDWHGEEHRRDYRILLEFRNIRSISLRTRYDCSKFDSCFVGAIHPGKEKIYAGDEESLLSGPDDLSSMARCCGVSGTECRLSLGDNTHR